eukprot:CAMPEP_0179029274 /NCGR_PEP_ID=MMETSP0796-20121207/9971_1 /TAXON_ID=73915 /ORGANISM="Pyrodinium bahamense, Strain pbaha01" /LENGTH=122 /DNA_ID=CAMNT_0020725431 /DNA_START=96 /DNA_END=461 /DNA_ORIENTATION=-
MVCLQLLHQRNLAVKQHRERIDLGRNDIIYEAPLPSCKRLCGGVLMLAEGGHGQTKVCFGLALRQKLRSYERRPMQMSRPWLAGVRDVCALEDHREDLREPAASESAGNAALNAATDLRPLP